MDTLLQDLRYAIRTLRRAPAFTLAAIATLALGIGANSAIFSLVNAVLLRPAPYPEPDRIVILGYTFGGEWVPRVSPAKFNLWREHARTLESLSAVRFDRVNVSEGADTEQIPAAHVSAEFFRLFGAPVAKGRTFTSAEDRPDGDPVVILSDGFWRRHFGGEEQAVGKSVPINGIPSVVVGILGSDFDTTIFGVSPDMWMPVRIDPHSTSHPPSLWAAARLKPHTSLAAGNADAELAGDAFRRSFPEAAGPKDTFAVAPFQDVMVRGVRWSLLVFMGAVSVVLLISCANLANLMLARASARQREIAIRASIGASRGRIVRQLLTESLVLSIVGGGLGLAVGAVGIRALLALNPGDIPRIGPRGSGVSLDWRVLTFTLLVSVATGLLFGAWPALRAARADLTETLMSRGRRSLNVLRLRSARTLLVTAELALALVLLVGAALLMRTFVALRTANRGFDPQDVVTMRMPLNDPRFATTPAVAQLVREGRARVGTVAGVVAVGAAVSLPLESDWLTSFQIVGRPLTSASPVLASERIVSPGYLEVFRIPLIRGRAFTDADRSGVSQVALVNETMARRFWPQGDPLGDQVVLFPGFVPEDDPPRQIIGIVSDVRDGSPLNQDVRPTVYVPMAQVPARLLHAEPLAWVIRAKPSTTAIEPGIRNELRLVSGRLAPANVRSMDAILAASTAGTWFATVLMAIFGGSSVLLACVGVFGVTAYSVQQRTHEFGIRLALGAQRKNVRNLLLAEGLSVALCGTVVGLAGAFGLSRVLRSFLFGVTPHDPLVLVVTPLVLIAVALMAMWVPAHRATRLDPATTLRSE
jgi:putative ABC transport system permease protein